VEVSFFVLRPEIEDRDEVEVVIGRSIKTSSILNDIEPANLNTNTNRSLDIGDFCKKKPETAQFLFFYAPGIAQLFLTFFKCTDMWVCQVTPCLKGHFAKNTSHYCFLFAEKKKQFVAGQSATIRLAGVGGQEVLLMLAGLKDRCSKIRN
jgi:hypothetical protein